MASSSTLLGVILAVSMFGAGIVTERLTNVYITNLPLDEQGNLRIKSAEKAPQLCKDSVEIDVLDWASRFSYTNYDQGALLYDGYDVELAFSFNPKQSFINVTTLWITVVAFANYYQYPITFNITLNGKVTITAPEKYYAYTQVSAVSMKVGQNACLTFTPGINTMTLSNPRYIDDGRKYVAQMEVFRVEAFIEYEYLA